MTVISIASFQHVKSTASLRGETLRARVHLPAHQQGLAEGGLPGERHVDDHRQRARAGLGMQITGATPVLWSEVWADGLTPVNIDDRIIPPTATSPRPFTTRAASCWPSPPTQAP